MYVYMDECICALFQLPSYIDGERENFFFTDQGKVRIYIYAFFPHHKKCHAGNARTCTIKFLYTMDEKLI